jgi:diguanylate cyclase (GGDEF)-like protein
VAREIAKQMMEQSGPPDTQSLQAMSDKLDIYRTDLFSFRDSANNRFTDTIDHATSDADGAVSTGVVIGLLSLCLTLGFGTAIARALLRQLQQALKVAQTVAAGDLTSRIEVTSRDETGQLLQALKDMNDSLVRSVDEHKRLEALLQHQASHDTLTGLPNRALLQDRLKQAIATATRSPSPIWIIFVDLDRFKLVNDSLGHKAGDAMLKQVAARLQSAVRESDTVARLGGDEFVLILPERVDGSGSLSAAVVQRILDAVAGPMIIEGHEFVTTCSMGIAVYPDDGADGETLMTRADIAMYSAKEVGRNNFRFYAPAMDARLLERLRLEGELRHALERNELELHYQPQVDLRSGRIVGMESLIRWNHPELGMIPPGKFISLAEETGLIVPIGAWVMRTACAQNQAWQRAGLGRLRVAVNLSARQFAQKNLAESIMNVLDETGLAAQDLEIELTESLVMTDVERAVGVLRDLKEIGVQLSIDDFGTGYSSLSYLKRFPIHVLKIDQSFVRDIAAGTDDAAIVALIISLAHSLKLNVIAEGVETPEQLAYLNQHGCDEMQGYLFSKPVPAAAFEKMLRDGKCLSLEFDCASA